MRHVLVIEDEYLMARCVADIVMYAGASSVEIAGDEVTAVDAAQRHRPSVIISDVDLKEGGTGPDAVARIRALYGNVPVIFVTGDQNDRQACTLGATVLAKPVTAHCLASTFQAVTGDMPRWREQTDVLQVISSVPDCR